MAQMFFRLTLLELLSDWPLGLFGSLKLFFGLFFTNIKKSMVIANPIYAHISIVSCQPNFACTNDNGASEKKAPVIAAVASNPLTSA